MELTVGEITKNTEFTLKYWKKTAQEINAGVFQYDGTIPNSCMDALCNHKVKILEETLTYLESLDKDLVISNGLGLSKEGVKYYELINK